VLATLRSAALSDAVTAVFTPEVAFASYWLRATFRRSWRPLAGTAVLLGLIGGLSLFALAGARRTQSAYPRFLRSTNPSTMVVDVGGLNEGGYEAMDFIARLPQVAQARAYAAYYVAPWVNGAADFSQNFEALGSIDGRYFVQDRFTAHEGRLPDPSRADEVAVNEESARRYGYHVGQQIDFATAAPSDVAANVADGQPRLLTHATIVGVGQFIEEVMQDDTDRSPLVLFTPAYVAEAKGLETYAWQGLVLRNGDADIAAVTAAITAAGLPQLERVTSTDTFHAQQAIRPVSFALAGFGVIVGLACLVLVGQALARQVRSGRRSHDIARSLGAGPRHLAAAAAIGPLLAVVAGAVLAAVAAVLASPAMPIGPVRRVEAAPGLDLDWTVVGLGAVVLVVVLFAVVAVVARQESPARVERRDRLSRSQRPGRVIGAGKLPPTAAMGLRFSLASGTGSTAVPVRSVMASAVVALATLTATVTFGASMSYLVSHPHLFGWNWDVALVDGGGYGNTKPAATEAAFSADDDIEAWSGAFYGAADVNGQNLALLGMEAGSAVTPPIRDGRMIERPGEIVLGTATVAQLHVGIGDTVQTTSGPLRVVGTATLPTIGVVHGDHTSLGVGGIVITTQLPGYDRNVAGGDPDVSGPTPAADYGPNVLFVRFRDGADRQAAVARLEGEVQQLADYNGVAVTPVQRSAEIVNADDISGSSAVLAGAVALSALASLALALTAAVRRHRRDLALLKALGFTRRQVSATIAWQATSTVAVGLVIGVPVGVVLGRLLWQLFARELDVVAAPAVPLIAITLIVVVAIIAANALAALPARSARAVPAALALRDE
jgi:hypothetical protein